MATFDADINAVIEPLANAASAFIFYSVPLFGAQVPLIVLWLVVGGLFFTTYLGFVNVRGFRHALAIVTGRYRDPDDPGQITQFQALTTAVSGTVGIGNIAGVAVAISVGGPGATFWMIVAGFLGMSTKFAECTLGVKYRRYENGVVSGGPMYYLERGLSEAGAPRLGKALGMFYAAAMVVGCLGIGNMFQSNQATQMIVNVTGGPNSVLAEHLWVVGVVLAIAVGVVIIGGIRTIAATTSKLVPGMGILYVAAACIVIALNYQAVPAAFAAIWDGAFNPQGIAGGMVGVMIIGFRRAVFSNEAGLGSAAIAHATAQTQRPVSEGYVALLEPFIDTVVICTLTALVIIVTVYDPSLAGSDIAGIELTTRAFASTLSWAPYLLSIAAILFAYSTMVAWAYYGLKAFTYLAGDNRILDLSFKLFFLAFVVLGASIELAALIALSDALVFIVAIPNLLGLYVMAPLIKQELHAYDAHLHQQTR